MSPPWHCLKLSPWPFPCVRLNHWSFSCVSPKPCLRPWSGASPCLSLWPHLFSVHDLISVTGPDPGSAFIAVYAANPDPMSVLAMSLSLSLTLPLFQSLPSIGSWSSSRCCLCFYLGPHHSPLLYNFFKSAQLFLYSAPQNINSGCGEPPNTAMWKGLFFS